MLLIPSVVMNESTCSTVTTRPLTTTGGDVIEYACGSNGGIRRPSLRFTEPPRPNVVQSVPSRASIANS